MKKELLCIENGVAEDPQHEVFRRLYIRVFQGEAIGMVFDNANERKRLIELLKGDMTLSAGRIEVLGESILPEETPKLFRKNIGIVERDIKLIRSLDIEENIFLCVPEVTHFFVGKFSYIKAVEKLREELDIDISKFPDVEHLSQKERILLEMVKNYVEGRRLIVFSNISNLLNENELDEIYDMTLRMRKLGIGFIVIETFDEIIMKWTDTFLIVKNGKTMGVFESAHTDANKIYALLLKGDQSKKEQIPWLDKSINEEEWETVLEFNHVSTDHLKDFNLLLGKGEIIKIYYTDDASSTHLVELLSGMRKPISGTLRLDEKKYSVKNAYQAVKYGICLIDEQVEQRMLLKNMTVFENVSLLMGEKIPFFWMRKRFERNVRSFLETYLGEEYLDTKLEGLEPAYLQQMIYYRWLIYHPQVVVCIKPFSQEDIHVRETAVTMIKALSDRGIAVIILTAKFSDIHLIEGENIFLRNGRTIDEDEVYQFLYSKDR